jgi:peroxiredoxin (alkyl hydroperoxide reductase subunit C)
MTLRLGDTAPDFEQDSSIGRIKFHDWAGDSWVVLFSHPADFTPVCTTELTEFARRAPEVEKLNTKLVGLSIDSVFSHLAWTRNMEEKFGVKVPYPIIADLDMKVASAYGMVHPGASSTATVRAVFVIDDKSVVSAMVYYQLTNGLNIDEILRLVEALQTSDKNGVATPCNWKPGEKVIVPPPQTAEAAEKRMSEAYEVTDWYFSKKAL